MTARQIFNHVLTELNKSKAPSLLLEDFVYFLNKTVFQYTNKIYNLYEINQQKTDDLQALAATAVLSTSLQQDYPPIVGGVSTSALSSNVYKVNLPDDYLHLLGCIVEFKLTANKGCFLKDSITHKGAKKMTSDILIGSLNNYYFKPSYKNPYYFITNVNSESEFPTATTREAIDYDSVEKSGGERYGNPYKSRMEIRYGNNALYQPINVHITYLKVPEYINLTQDNLDEVEDTSQILEFPEYVCYEIINDLLKLLLENTTNPRLQTHIPINQTIPGK